MGKNNNKKVLVDPAFEEVTDIDDIVTAEAPEVANPVELKVSAANGLRVRKNPDGDVLGVLVNGSKVTELEAGDTWTKIKSEELEGWCMTKFLIKA